MRDVQECSMRHVDGRYLRSPKPDQLYMAEDRVQAIAEAEQYPCLCVGIVGVPAGNAEDILPGQARLRVLLHLVVDLRRRHARLAALVLWRSGERRLSAGR